MSQISNGAFNALRRQLQQALETAEALRSELRGAVIINSILASRLGGEVTVTDKELSEKREAFSFRSHYDEEKKAYVFTTTTLKAEYSNTEQTRQHLVLGTPSETPSDG